MPIGVLSSYKFRGTEQKGKQLQSLHYCLNQL